MNICFVTGTRADFGKLKPLITKLSVEDSGFNVSIVVTGMHLLEQFGNTAMEVEKVFPGKSVHLEGQKYQEEMTFGFARFTRNFGHYLEENEVDLVVVHGDRFDALAAAIVSNSFMTPVAHIEGGEVSGTIDEAIRHSVSKFSHIHFVANEEAHRRVRRLGENPEYIFVVGSPETDVLLGEDLPSIENVRSLYDVEFENYAILCFHPVVNEVEEIEQQLDELEEFILNANNNFIWVYPNNDKGSALIIDRIKKLSNLGNLKSFESLRFECYISLLRNADYIVGNTSSGVREAPVLGVPSINIGSRQNGRVESDLVFNSDIDTDSMLCCLEKIKKMSAGIRSFNFGSGSVSEQIATILEEINIRKLDVQKFFHD